MIFFLEQPKWIKTDSAQVLILHEDFCSMMGPTQGTPGQVL